MVCIPIARWSYLVSSHGRYATLQLYGFALVCLQFLLGIGQMCASLFYSLEFILSWRFPGELVRALEAAHTRAPMRCTEEDGTQCSSGGDVCAGEYVLFTLLLACAAEASPY